MKTVAAFLACLLATAPAVAQDWATRDLCLSDPVPVTAKLAAPHDLAVLSAEASLIANPIGKFWRITHPNGAESHLWGTMHVAHPVVLDLPDIAKDAIDDARVVALEIDFTYPDRDAIYTRYDLPGRYREGGDPFAPQGMLDLSYLGSDAEGWVLDRLDSMGAGEDGLFVLTYAGLAELLLSDPCEDFTTGVIPTQDSLIQTYAHIAGAAVRGLEPPGEYVADLAKDPDTAKAVVAVYASYLQPPANTEAYNAFIQLYREGRLGLMAAWDAAHLQSVYPNEGLSALQRTDAYLLAARNDRFLSRIASDLQTGDVFMAVGAAHLPGETGLVEGLRAEGYTVTRIPLPGEAP